MEFSVAEGRVVELTDHGPSFAPASVIIEAVQSSEPVVLPSGVRFSTTALEPFIALRGSAQGLTADLVVERGGEIWNLNSDDHILVAGEWFPLDPVVLAQGREWINQRGTALTFAAFVDAHKARYSELRVVDMVQPDAIAGLMPAVDAPGSLEQTFYGYQRDGFRWLVGHSTADVGAILADEMGLGKTLQVIALLAHERQRNSRPSLVVVPLTLIESWAREIRRFAPELRFYRHVGGSRARRPAAIAQVDVVLTTYDLAVIDRGVLEAVNWNVLVLDEAQAIKNPDTMRARALSKIPRRLCVAVTGTPLENKPLDLWSIVNAVDAGYLGTRDQFDGEFAWAPKALREATAPLILRREVSQVAPELPKKVVIDVALDMFEPEVARYLALIDEVAGDQAHPPLSLITKLRQFTAHPSLVDASVPAGPDASAKLTRAIEILEEVIESGQKALVFAAFHGAADLLANVVERQLRARARIVDGRTPAGSRQHVVDAFSDDREPGVLILNPIAAGVGLNITAASHVIHYTLEWNPAKEDQASARAWRRGQERPVMVHRLYYINSIDEVIDERLKAKRDLFHEVVAQSPESESELSALLLHAVERAGQLR